MGNNVFINYRRDDTGGMAVAIYQNLITHFPPETLFKDFNTIRPGYDFVESINQALAQCDVLLVLIGKSWLSAKDEDGNVRLFKDDDYVRMEIARCLQKNIPVIPVLLDRVRMPAESELPEDLKPLRRRQSINIDNDGFEQDMERLVKAIREITGIPERFAAQPVTPSPGQSTFNPPAEKPGNFRAHCYAAAVISVLFLLNYLSPSVQEVGVLMAGFSGYCLYLSFQIDKNWKSNDFTKAQSQSGKLRTWVWVTIIAGFLLGGVGYNYDNGLY